MDRILAGEERDLDVQSVVTWPKEIVIPFDVLTKLLPKLVRWLQDGSVRFCKTDYLHLDVLEQHIR